MYCAGPVCHTLLVTAYLAWYRQGSTTNDAAGDALASKEPSAFLNHHKLRTSQSERELPALIPSHTPEGGRTATPSCILPYTALQLHTEACVWSLHTVDLQPLTGSLKV